MFGPFDPSLAPDRLARALLALLLPALAEEAVFRWPVARRRTRRAALLSAAAFALWHPLGGWLLPPARPVLWDPVFLLLATALGAACAWSARRSGTVWPAVAIHWAAVAGWTLLWGGPDFGP